MRQPVSKSSKHCTPQYPDPDPDPTVVPYMINRKMTPEPHIDKDFAYDLSGRDFQILTLILTLTLTLILILKTLTLTPTLNLT